MKHVVVRYVAALSCSDRSSPKVSQIIPVTIESTIDDVKSCAANTQRASRYGHSI